MLKSEKTGNTCIVMSVKDLHNVVLLHNSIDWYKKHSLKKKEDDPARLRIQFHEEVQQWMADSD